MADVSEFFDAIDSARIGRLKELSEIKRIFTLQSFFDPLLISSKTVVVLTYANWEGFYNECVHIYLDFLQNEGKQVVDVGWLMLTGALTSSFESLRARNHSSEARKEFVFNLKTKLNCGFSEFDRSIVTARSNLNFSRLIENFNILDFDLGNIIPYKIRIDKELVGWRHAVAHGNPPDLSKVDVAAHLEFASSLMLLVADSFQEAIINHI